MFWRPGQADPSVISGVDNWEIGSQQEYFSKTLTLKLFNFNSTYKKVIVTVAIILQVYLKWVPKVIQEFIRLS